MLLDWRNLPHVRRFMFGDHAITSKEHDGWFTAMLGDDSRRYWVIEWGGVPVGTANLYDIDLVHQRASWGVYLADPAVRGRGVGGAAEFLVLEHVFEEMRLKKLSAEVVAFNEPAMAMYRSFGFAQDGVLRHHVKRGSEFHDVVIFSLLDTEWHAQKEELLRKLEAKGVL